MGTGSIGNEDGHRRRSQAIAFVIMLGLVSLLADVATEGTRSIMGPYLVLLGASATAVGIVAGLSELIGYSLRIVFGWVADKRGHYWILMFVGYAINLIAVPAMALAGDWVAAVCLIMLERVGRAIRSPARDAMLSHAGKEVGRGWSYGLQEALSSIGGMVGPMVVVLVLFLDGDYRMGFEILLIPALMAVVLLAYARKINPDPSKMEIACPHVERKGKFSRLFWIYIMAGALIACGYADFPLIAFHIGNFAMVSEGWIPIMYAIAMAADALAALFFGKLYDRVGVAPLVVVSAIVPLFVPLIFSNDFTTVAVGMVLYGVGFGAQESVMRAMVADMTPHDRRGFAFGCYNAAFGVSWFLGSLAMGILYDVSLPAMMALSMLLQFAAIPLFVIVMRGYPFGKAVMEYAPPTDPGIPEGINGPGTPASSAMPEGTVLVVPKPDIPPIGTPNATGAGKVLAASSDGVLSGSPPPERDAVEVSSAER